MGVTLYYTLPQVAVLCGIPGYQVKTLSERFGIHGRYSGAVTVFTSEQARQIRVLSELITRSKDDLVALIVSGKCSTSIHPIA